MSYLFFEVFPIDYLSSYHLINHSFLNGTALLLVRQCKCQYSLHWVNSGVFYWRHSSRLPHLLRLSSLPPYLLFLRHHLPQLCMVTLMFLPSSWSFSPNCPPTLCQPQRQQESYSASTTVSRQEGGYDCKSMSTVCVISQPQLTDKRPSCVRKLSKLLTETHWTPHHVIR